MDDAGEHSLFGDEVERQAATWVLRCDRGLTPAEQDDFSSWLAANPRHGEQLARHREHWKRLDRLVDWRPEHGAQPNPDLLAPSHKTSFKVVVPFSLALAAAAVVAMAFILRSPKPSDTASHPVVAAPPSVETQRVLSDGSIVELNAGTVISTDFTGSERRVRLEKGEAHFTVAKDHLRPFVVTVHGIDVRALGTAFNVRLGGTGVEVLVTEGRIQVDAARGELAGGPAVASLPKESFDLPQRINEFEPSRDPQLPAPLVPILEARQRVIVSLDARPEVSQIATLTQGEIERVMAWQHRLLEFTATPMSEIVGEFNRRNVAQLIIADPELGAMRMTVTFRSDNLEGFVRLVEGGFGVKVERRSEAEIVLHKSR